MSSSSARANLIFSRREALSSRSSPRRACSPPSEENLLQKLAGLKTRVVALDQQISPIARAATELNNRYWGLLMRTGNDKSHLAYQVERYADIYTSRVSNLMAVTPFAYLR